jgi:hypothetical protein
MHNYLSIQRHFFSKIFRKKTEPEPEPEPEPKIEQKLIEQRMIKNK